MPNIQPQDILIGLVAGAATAILSLGVAMGSGLSILLYLVSAVPLMVAGLGWGLSASLLGTVIAGAAMTVFADARVALFVLATTAVPAVLAAWWLSLSRPAEEIGGPEGHVAWFPLADVLFRLGIIVSAVFIGIGYAIGYGPELTSGVVDELINRLQVANPEWIGFTGEGREQFAAAFTNTLPVMQPAMWMLVLTTSLYFALAITRTSGLLKRPKDDWPSMLRLTRIGLIVFAVGAALSFLSGGIGHIGGAIAGPMAAIAMMAGFALFHDRSRGKPWRTIALVTIYAAVAMFMVPAVPFLFAGMLMASRPIQITPVKGNKPSGPST